MKPSERIQQLQKELYEVHKSKCFNHGFEPCGYGYNDFKAKAIELVLDEMAEKTKLAGMGFGEF